MTGYMTADRSKIAAVEGLDVKDPLVAQWLAARPIATIDPEVEVFEPEVEPEKQYNLKPFALQFGEFVRHRSTAKDSKSWLDQFKALLPAVVKDATLMVMDDVPVATFRHVAPLNFTKLSKEQPQIVAKYTKWKWEAVFDRAAFEAEEPAMYTAYRGRQFRLVNSGPGAGLVLPS